MKKTVLSVTVAALASLWLAAPTHAAEGVPPQADTPKAERMASPEDGAYGKDGKDGKDCMRKYHHKKGDFFKRMDKDGDGVVSKDEFMAAGEDRFKKMDRNGDGKLDKSDMPPRPPHEGGPRGGDGPDDDLPPPPAPEGE